jgi:2-oxoisovalerate dehydrogenase E2 component (dihydrolipoyl transacylase)
MTQYLFKLPDIGEGITQAEISAWRVAVGDTVGEDQPLADVLTEKAAVELPSPVAGTVRELRGKPGDFVAVGSPLVVLDVQGGVPRQQAEPAVAPAPSAVPAAPAFTGAQAAQRPAGERPLAAPAVRQRARELGIDLAGVKGSGPGGRVTHADLDAPAAGKAPQNGQRREAVEEIPVIGVRRRIAEAMQRAKQRIPHFAYVEEVDVTELEALRQHLNAHRKPQQPKLTLLPFLVRALAQAAPRHPEVNATYDDEAGIVRRYAALHLGIATQTPNGLLVPVLRHAEALDLWQTAEGIARLAEAARTGKAARGDLSGSTLTLTSLGALGGIVSTPVINAPEVAVVGVNRMVERAVVREGRIVPRLMMNLSSSFDHRIVDGWNAAEFIQDLRQLLEHPATLFLPA